MAESVAKKVKGHSPPPELLRAEAAYMLSIRQITRTIEASTTRHVIGPMEAIVGDGGPGSKTRVRAAMAKVNADVNRKHPPSDREARIGRQLEEIHRASGELYVGGIAEATNMSPRLLHELELLGYGIEDDEITPEQAVEKTNGSLPLIGIALITARGMRASTKRADSRFRKSNRKLLGSLVKQHTSDLSKRLIEGIAGGSVLAALRKLTKSRNEIVGRRGDTIAQDQTQKGQGDQQRDRQLAGGIDGYMWKSQGDGLVRDLHIELNADSSVHPWKAPPPDPEGHPGEPIQCRCFAVPAMDQAIAFFESGSAAEIYKEEIGRRLLRAGV